jgi:hypothetical protein
MKTRKLNDFIYSMRVYREAKIYKYLYYLPSQDIYIPMIEPLHTYYEHSKAAVLVHKKNPNLPNHFSGYKL